jgi:glycosyltransferase involved in cell wall biosynthesis
MHKKKVLLISYHFPPSTAVGGVRISNFAKILPIYGWETYVLTLKDHHLRRLDTERLNDLSMVKIFKAGCLPSVRQIYLKLKVGYYRIIKKKFVTIETLEEDYIQTESGNADNPNAERILRRFKRCFISLFLSCPDLGEERAWFIPALFKALRLVKRYKFDCIITSSPPKSVHLVGLLVKKVTNVKWVADFRDPWMTPTRKEKELDCALSRKIELCMERSVMHNADKVLTTTKMLCNIFEKSFHARNQSKFIHISNGFDNKKFSRFCNLEKYKEFTISYTGTLYYGRSPEMVFKALKELILEGKLDIQDVSVRLIGNCSHVGGCSTDKLVKSYGLGSVVEISGQVPYSSSLEIIKRSHIALLLAPNQPFQIPAKVYDYMGLGVKILALTEEGATSDLVKSTGAGQAFDLSDIEGIKEFIYQAFSNRDLLASGCSSEILSKFDTIFIIKDLSWRMDKICNA